jgi:hypothetical protein
MGRLIPVSTGKIITEDTVKTTVDGQPETYRTTIDETSSTNKGVNSI